MLKSKRIKSLGLLAVSVLALVGCDNDEVKYPTNYKDPIFGDKVNGLDQYDQNVVGNDFKHYYQSASSSSEIYQKAVNQVLLDVSKIAHGYTKDAAGTDVAAISKDYYKGSVADGDISKIQSSMTDSNLDYRAKASMTTTAKGGSYSKDNLFYENKYAKYLNETYYYLNFKLSEVSDQGKLLTPFLQYSDIFSNNANYQTYMQKELQDDMRINYLTAEYIYQKSYASIGNSNARKVQIIALTDRSDEPGAAKKLLNAYINDYVKGDKKDKDFSVLSRLWKGITPDAANEIANSRYGSEIVLSADEEQWLREKDILPSDKSQDATSSGTLVGKVLADKKKLEAVRDNFHQVDTSLESTYTGSYAYDYKTGVRKAIDDIATKNLVTEGIYLSSSGISSIPSDLSSRIFSPKISTEKSTIDLMKEDAAEGKDVRRDITVYGKDGYRYLTTSDTISGTNDNLFYYDASSKTYYLTRILDVVSASALSTTNTSSIYDTAEKKEQIAREVAYTMSTTGSYKTNSIVYWLSRTDIKYSDEDFLEYMKSNYKDVFKSDNPYASEDKIVLPEA